MSINCTHPMCRNSYECQVTYEEANSRYTERFAHTDKEWDNETKRWEDVTYRPFPICTSKEMDEIFSRSNSWDEILEAMKALQGTPGPAIRRR